MSRKIVRRGKSFLQKLLSIVKSFVLWLGLFKREEEEKVIEVMKKGRMEEGGGVEAAAL
jgi:hypothetical protein